MVFSESLKGCLAKRERSARFAEAMRLSVLQIQFLDFVVEISLTDTERLCRQPAMAFEMGQHTLNVIPFNLLQRPIHGVSVGIGLVVFCAAIFSR